MIYILLPAHNRKDVTQRLIICLKSQTYQNYHLILIDDGSTDGTDEMVRAEIGPLTVIKGSGIWWWGGSLHQGYLWLKSKNIPESEFVLILNDDTEFESDFLEKGLKALGSRPRTLLQAQGYSKQTGNLIDMGVHWDWKNLSFNLVTKIEEINCLSTRGLLFRVGDFFEIGGFYPRLLPHYASDFEFTMRACDKGFKLITDPSFKLWINEVTTGSFHYNRTASFRDFFKKIFSKKYAANPIDLSVFIALACPWKWKFHNWFRVWSGVIWQGFRSILIVSKN